MDSLTLCYVLGEKLMDVVYQNAVMEALIQCKADGAAWPSDYAVRTAYKYTSNDSAIRRLVVDHYVWAAAQDWIEDDHISATCTEFVNDLLKALFKHRVKPAEDCERPWVKKPKSYRIKENKETKAGSSKSKDVAKA